jgi:hypothetical protein
MGDLTSPKLIIAKGFLFLLAGLMAAAALLLEYPSLKVAFLLGLSVWCVARFYYFAFYVIEHYVDPGYHFAGLGSFALYLLRRWRTGNRGAAATDRAPCEETLPLARK